MTSQEHFDLSESFFMIALHTPAEKNQVLFFQNPITVNRYIHGRHQDTYVTLHSIRLIGNALVTFDLWHGKAGDFENIDRVWKDESFSMCKSEKWQREADKEWPK